MKNLVFKKENVTYYMYILEMPASRNAVYGKCWWKDLVSLFRDVPGANVTRLPVSGRIPWNRGGDLK